MPFSCAVESSKHFHQLSLSFVWTRVYGCEYWSYRSQMQLWCVTPLQLLQVQHLDQGFETGLSFPRSIRCFLLGVD